MINLELLNPQATTLRRTTSTQAVGVPAAAGGGALLVHRAAHGLCSRPLHQEALRT